MNIKNSKFLLEHSMFIKTKLKSAGEESILIKLYFESTLISVGRQNVEAN